ncbi:MAG: alpha/beta fold hydrolase [Gemmatimonadaceae bacterium]
MYPAGIAGVRTHMLTTATGLRMRVVECGRAEGAPALLIHGWGACVYSYRFLLQALGGAGRRAVAFDLRGHGLSDKPVGRGRYAVDVLVSDVRDLIEGLGVERADVVGHSMGGGLALHFALAHPNRIRRLVLAAPVNLTRMRLPRLGHLLTPRVTDRFARYLTPRWLTSALLRSTYGDPTKVSEHDIDQYWAPSQFPAYYRATRALLEEFDWTALSMDQLTSLACQTLVVLSTADRLVQGAESAALRIPQAAVVDLIGAGHLGVEECASEFNRMVVEFLQRE